MNWSTMRAGAATFEVPALPTTVVVPHPDDEVLMFGGLIQTQRQRGIDVQVIAVTDGEAAYSDEDVHPDRLGAIRRREQMAALGHLGVDGTSVRRLGLGDGVVEREVDAIADAIVALGNPIVFAPWAHDHHCDHEACGNAALRARARTGAATYFGLFWSWTHTDPELLAHQRLVRLALAPGLRSARMTAIAAHRSQITDDVAPRMLGESDLDPLNWTSEYYVTDIEAPAERRLDIGGQSLGLPGRRREP